jgi:hypothetical protein
MTTKKAGNFSRMLRNVTLRMSRMPIMPRISIFTRSSRVMPTSIISESASNRATSNAAKSIEELQETLKFIEIEIIGKNVECKKKMEDARMALQSGNKKAARQHLFIAKKCKQLVKTLEIQKSNIKAQHDTLVSLTARVASASRDASTSRDASKSRKGGKIMRKSKRRIRRHKI